MNRLSVDGTDCFVTHRVHFEPKKVSASLIRPAAVFAYRMVFTAQGHHRNCRSGGDISRKNGEKFCNAFQGKLAELIVRQELISRNIEAGDVDLSIHGKNIWDDSDLLVQDKALSIKSMAFFSNLFLLECSDWDENGQYLPNLGSLAHAAYDYFVIVRLKPDLKSVFKEKGMLAVDNIAPQHLWEVIRNLDLEFDIPAYFTAADIRYIIKNRFVIPKNAKLNGKVPMDASNYYAQLCDGKKFDSLIEQLK